MSPRGKSTDDAPVPVGELGYEQARDELVEVVTTLERGGLDLDASLSLWERGEALANRCEEHLAGARDRIEAAINDGEDDADPDDD
ncbi:exodeoxyribonuclease VII small subunit [Gordonia sp. NB41Y]|uniref:exodeoxyribonuclease VII small subunit n=1 Tax=Gordonia sp. NB41Y TaxID=875808 RepID=UPI0002BD916B|nr:exodeoxyribonuclease VII small subunit [Gordonia sp. NB41Y]EMP13613.1 exodeoxyribonuclease VII small subunit [Gordonia sp. NB41Y]WLP91638.1 exodeoxyribonuclease VII small subunit [Gordonia sp. NB41Y]